MKLGMKHHLPCVFAGCQARFHSPEMETSHCKYRMVFGEIKGLWGQDETLHSRESACSVAVDRKPVSHGLQLVWR